MGVSASQRINFLSLLTNKELKILSKEKLLKEKKLQHTPDEFISDFVMESTSRKVKHLPFSNVESTIVHGSCYDEHRLSSVSLKE